MKPKKKKKPQRKRIGFGLRVPKGVVLKGSLSPTGGTSSYQPGDASDTEVWHDPRDRMEE